MINWLNVFWALPNERAGKKRGVIPGIRRWVIRGVLSLLGLWLAGIFLFAFLPVPFSAVMAERQVSAWLSGDFSYVARSTWVPMYEIAPVMALAVIAAEDQKFTGHAGFDMAAIRAALAHNERDGARVRGGSTLTQQMVKNLFLWDG